MAGDVSMTKKIKKQERASRDLLLKDTIVIAGNE